MLSVVTVHMFIRLNTGFEQLFPWVEIRSNLSFALSFSKWPSANEEGNKETKNKNKNNNNNKNEQVNEWNQRTRERKTGRKIMKGITFLDCRFAKRTNK